jgi:hypothetical protein
MSFKLFAGFFVCAVLTLAVGIFGAHHVYRQSEIFRQAAAALPQQTSEQASRQLIQHAFWAEVSCKNVAAAAVLASLIIVLIGGVLARKNKTIL